MYVLYVSFGSKVRPGTFGCIAMGSAVLFILRSRLFVYSTGSGANRVQVVRGERTPPWETPVLNCCMDVWFLYVVYALRPLM